MLILKTDVKSLTLAGIFTSIYLVLTLLSVYVFSFFSVLILLVLPVFSAYYSSVFSFKKTFLFNVSVIITCLMLSLNDPFYIFLYVLPTLIIGDFFGLLHKLKIKYYTTIFLQAIAYSIVNIITLFLGDLIYETKIMTMVLFANNHLSLSFLFILSGTEAIFTSWFVIDKLKSLNFKKEKETNFPLYACYAFFILFILAIMSYFISINFFFLIITILLILAIFLLIEFISKCKHYNVYLVIYVLAVSIINFYLCSLKLFSLVFIIILFPFLLYSVVKMVVYIYNINTI